MSLLAKRSVSKEDKSNIITLGAIAGKEKAKDPTVINSTIGMLYGEDGKLFVFDSVNKALNNLTDKEKYAYASTPGSNEFHEAIKHWVFREYYDEFMNNSYTSVMATPGGTGALSNVFSNYLNEGDYALLPNYMWGNYKQIAYETYAAYKTYNLFDEAGNFNITDLKEKVLTQKKEQNRVFIVINDPCQNPTGYSMKDSEWDMVIDILNEVSNDGTPTILLHDMAYIDYDLRGFDATRKNIRKYLKLNDSVITIMAFSGSKTLGLYGIRIGAMLAVTKKKEYIDEFFSSAKFASRSKWSNSSMLGQSLITKIFTETSLRTSFEKELELARNTLINRAKTFETLAKEYKLEMIPFECGFFLAIPCENPEEVYKLLVTKKIHIIPMNKFIRVTISSITTSEVQVLPKMIKWAIEETTK